MENQPLPLRLQLDYGQTRPDPATKFRFLERHTHLRILVTNDDGIHAPGLVVAEAIARSLTDDVWIIAPETEQSGASHSLTLALPLRLRSIGPKRFAVSGTPTDCVMMGMAEVMKDTPPTLILSGVNRGANMADDVTYSGTIAGAMEGCALGVPSVALSLEHDGDPKWDCARVHGPTVLRKLVESGWPEGVLININFPDCLPGDVVSVDVVAQGKRDLQTARLDRRVDARGYPYFWIGFRRVLSQAPIGTDLHSISENKIAVTPLHLNLTEQKIMQEMKSKLGTIALT